MYVYKRLRRALLRVQRFVKYRVLHVDDTPHRIALSVAIGIAVAWTPTIGVQMALTVVLCTALRANKLVGVPLAWISNPLTIIPIYYPSYLLGRWLTSTGGKDLGQWRRMVAGVFDSGLPIWDRALGFWKFAMEIAVPLWIGSLLIGLTLGAAAYWITYRAVVRHRLRVQRRRRKRAVRKTAAALRRVKDPAAGSPAFILASSSPRRRQLLREAGYSFRVVPPSVNEPDVSHPSMLPAQQAEALAYFKARSVYETVQPGVPVLGADTVVALNNEIFGKPRDAADARRILTTLSGTQHQVISGVALVGPYDQRMLASAITEVRMRELTPAEVDAYIDGGLWAGKSGAYGVQDTEDPVVECVSGSFTNVVGLPMELLDGLFNQMALRYKV